jgi:endoglucanase
MTGLYPERYLHTQGSKLYDATGKLVDLRGADTGGWLFPEGWMDGMNGASGNDAVFRSMPEDLEKRFSQQQATTLENAWYDHWFTAADFNQIASLGFNALRVPFSWRNLQNAQGQWMLDSAGGTDFTRLDWAVTQAAAHNIYLVIDFHMWQGQLANYATINTSGPDGDTQRNEGVQIWTAVATHYKGNGVVAGFDLINEPTLSGGSPGDLPQHAFFTAVRNADPNRIAIVESDNFADIHDFPNSMWSDHYPNGGWNNGAGWDSSNFNGPGNPGDGSAPIFIGEFHASNDAGTQVGTSLDQSGQSWTVWSYKTVGQGSWGLYDEGSGAQVDILSASYDQILSVWTGLPALQQTPQSGLLNGLSAAAKAPMQ